MIEMEIFLILYIKELLERIESKVMHEEKFDKIWKA
jgi:hypothetical protein